MAEMMAVLMVCISVDEMVEMLDNLLEFVRAGNLDMIMVEWKVYGKAA